MLSAVCNYWSGCPPLPHCNTWISRWVLGEHNVFETWAPSTSGNTVATSCVVLLFLVMMVSSSESKKWNWEDTAHTKSCSKNKDCSRCLFARRCHIWMQIYPWITAPKEHFGLVMHARGPNQTQCLANRDCTCYRICT